MPDFVTFDDADHAAAERYAVANSGPVSTLTHSTAFVARHFLEWRERQKLKKVVNRIQVKSKSNGGLREAAFAMFAKGSTPKQVSVELEITYANAHYYSRAFKKSC